jgi:hypothetical protein
MQNKGSAASSVDFVLQSEVNRIAGLSLAHKLTVNNFLATGRWVIVNEGRDINV